jgi:hypothetical protein
VQIIPKFDAEHHLSFQTAVFDYYKFDWPKPLFLGKNHVAEQALSLRRMIM